MGYRAPVPIGGLKARTLRRLKVDASWSMARDILEEAASKDPNVMSGPLWSAHLVDRLTKERQRHHPGRRGLPDTALAQTAAAYLRHCGSGVPPLVRPPRTI